MSKTLFIIGANASVAQGVLARLARDFKIITAGRHDSEVYCDVTSEVAVPDGVDAVINFAASFGGPDAKAMMEAVETNVLGALRVCEAAKVAGVRQVVHISSVFALLRAGEAHFSAYALTKRQGDEVAEYYCRQNDQRLCVLRPSRIYGDGDTLRKGQPMLYDLIDKVAAGEDIELHGSKDAKRNYIHVDDLAEILVRVIQEELAGAYSCMSPADTTVSEIIDTARKVYGTAGKTTWLPDKPDIGEDTVPVDLGLYEKIAFRPQISIEQGIARIKQHREGAR